MIVTTVGIEVPGDFPAEKYNSIHEHLKPFFAHHDEAFKQYAGAYNAVPIRFRSAVDAEEEFVRSMGRVMTPEERYVQEKALFGFFGNLHSCLDSLAYSIHAIGAMLNPPGFLLTKESLRAVALSRIAGQLRGLSPELGTALETLSNDSRFLELKELRNALEHRASGTRTHTEPPPNGPGSGVSWPIDHLRLNTELKELAISPEMTAPYRLYVGEKLHGVLAILESLISRCGASSSPPL